MNVNLRRLACAGLIFLSGCGLFGKKRPEPIVRPVSHETTPVAADARPKMLAIANGNTGRTLEDPRSYIPSGPGLDELGIPPMPNAPPKENALAALAKTAGEAAPGIVVPAGVRLPTDEPSVALPPPVTPAPAAAETSLQSVKRVQQLAADKLARLDGFEARLTRREMIAGKPAPEQVVQYKFRAEPMSVHMKWVGLEAKGRELVYVAGRKGDPVNILTARGDGTFIIPAGKRMTFTPTDPAVRGQSRYDLREGGMALAVKQLGQTAAKADRDPASAALLRYLGRVQKPERQTGLEAVEQTILPGTEPLFPKGGKRTLYFDPEPSSPSHGLPILVTAVNEAGREVEYYYFENLKPAKFSDADFDVNVLWKTR